MRVFGRVLLIVLLLGAIVSSVFILFGLLFKAHVWTTHQHSGQSHRNQ